MGTVVSHPQWCSDGTFQRHRCVWKFGINLTGHSRRYDNEAGSISQDEPWPQLLKTSGGGFYVAQGGGRGTLWARRERPFEEKVHLQRMTEGPEEGVLKRSGRSLRTCGERRSGVLFVGLSQEHLTSTEEMIDGEEEEEQFTHCSQQSPGLRGQRSRYAKNRREAKCDGDGEGEEGLMSPTEEDGGGYGAFTLPCRRSHCLSEGLAGLGIPAAPCPAFQGRRAQTTQDISGVLGEGSEYGDSGIDGVRSGDERGRRLVSRRCKNYVGLFLSVLSH
ncbi:T-lymphoma invasion and metastasis-inducing protein 1-like protein [Lates japonicus]|uniref:T-lymphoma invasion and metastasis-inducing protein 1-like protein n=1 Tax=Lates japonicus TaxID=270547 RepID=A0AAD3NFQ8_LATJO|nr:T-lymphoma invasion and metastasis-inducing protein 1-like protein [Lates japonicus]